MIVMLEPILGNNAFAYDHDDQINLSESFDSWSLF